MSQDPVDTVKRLGHQLIESAQTRLKLLQSEAADELDRLGALIALQILTALSALLTVQFLALVVLALVWDTPWRTPAMIGITVLAGTGTFMAYKAYEARKVRHKPVFDDSVKELETDRRLLEKGT